MKLIDKDALVAEINRRLEAISSSSNKNNRELAAIRGAQQHELINLALFLNTLEAKGVDLENYNKVKNLLSLSFMHFLDANRPEGKMCLSNGECFDIEKAFDELDFAKLFRYMEKYLKAQKGE